MAIQQRTGDAKVKGVADIVFVFDCTGSMKPYIDNVKENVTALVRGFNSEPNVKLDWRVRAIGYRDFYCHPEECLFDDNEFTNDIDEFANNQLSKMTIGSGGDFTESTIDAIWYALKKSDWRSRCTKVIVVFTDDRPKKLHPRTMDELGVPEDIEYLQQELMKQKIQLFMYCQTDPVYEQLHMAERAHVYQYDEPGEQLLNSDFGELLEVIGKTVSASIITDNKTL